MFRIDLPVRARTACILALLLLLTPVVQAKWSEPYTLLVFGDSLSAAYGIDDSLGWAALLADRLVERQIGVVNRSVSGETTAGGVRRLPAILDDVNPDLVMIELGGNDGLRGLSIDAMRDNLSLMISASLDAGAEVLLIGMHIPPNYGPDYTAAFDAVFTDLATQFKVALLPFLLEPVAHDWDLMQQDGIHPTADAQPLLLEHVWTSLEPLLPPMSSDD